MWTTLDIGGRPADVFTPVDRPRFVLLFLADWNGKTLSGNSVWTSLLAANRFACVCPDGAQSWWSSRVCTAFDPTRSGERYFLDNVVPWSMNQFRAAENAIALTGVGMGGQGALRFAFKYPKQFRVVASMNAAIDHYELYGRGTCLDEMYPSREHCRQDGVMLHVDPMNWPPYVTFACDPESPWLRGNDRLHEKLMALGAPHEFDFATQACGHSWTYFDHLAPAMMRFMIDGLEKESRRLM